MNQFAYVFEASPLIFEALVEWDVKSKEYLRLFFSNEIYRTRRTQFGDCISKVGYLIERVFEEPENFRGVKDVNDKLQAAAMVEDYFDCLYIDTLTNAPWNVIDNQPETVKGAATTLIEELVRESLQLGYNGRLRVITIERAKPFYSRIGFIDDEDGSFVMELTPQAAESFLDQQQRRREQSN
ncbi:MAG: hypothetical protein KME60_12280 [Cyanomargarita calcarea GSE-NOS-MK-12-04C]|jgi:hypothetical protein|uniref:Uncharacterized protein n=1 Tax=Cyanomargarita calcarea GSE-NOS-MK-12-04C TaxID=2839659 RepID=A0A951QLP8_9CYAN|nr:hypothetical protein [Cyanomargarita calcarea GSE-NOS-MK-12-04C]